MKDLVKHWHQTYNWREQEMKINKHKHYKTRIDGIDIHFIHVKSKSPKGFPLMLIHG